MCSVARGSTVGRQAAERGDVLVELPLGLFGDLADRLVQRQIGIFLRRARVDLVVDVGDVAHIGDVLGAVEMAQQPEQHVEHDDRPRIADMGEVVDRRPAHIHAHARGIDRRERALRARQGIVQRQLHRTTSHPIAIVRLDLSGAETEQCHPALLAGRPKLSIRRTDGRSQRRSLANNLAANAADMVEAAHCGGEWASAEVASRASLGRIRGPSGRAPSPGPDPPLAGDRKIDRQCGFHVLVTYRQSPLTHTLVRRGDGAVRLGAP